MTRWPITSMKSTNAPTLPSVMASGSAMPTKPRAGLAFQKSRQRRQQHQRQHHGEVLDDQPADRDASALGVDQPPLLQRAQQHDGGGDRQRETEHEPAAERPAKPGRKADAHQRRRDDLHDRAGHGDRAHRQQVLQREMQADAEHQQDDADLGELVGEMLVGDVARRERPHQHAGEQITDQRRDAEPLRQRPKANASTRPTTMVEISGVS